MPIHPVGVTTRVIRTTQGFVVESEYQAIVIMYWREQSIFHFTKYTRQVGNMGGHIRIREHNKIRYENSRTEHDNGDCRVEKQRIQLTGKQNAEQQGFRLGI
ncbi:hypothetical protein Pmani_034677 [Petrolisthes manimaculis]|uniref:Uncharacterized protein n=1 Tax=Petrolisthes manimaculis TaxID=1843537 RepID=A0AAE1NN83_9EUCA|nr:hypothetical protein Pmani_034677 [Petrolisthes manimaculis]